MRMLSSSSRLSCASAPPTWVTLGKTWESLTKFLGWWSAYSTCFFGVTLCAASPEGTSEWCISSNPSSAVHTERWCGGRGGRRRQELQEVRRGPSGKLFRAARVFVGRRRGRHLSIILARRTPSISASDRKVGCMSHPAIMRASCATTSAGRGLVALLPAKFCGSPSMTRVAAHVRSCSTRSPERVSRLSLVLPLHGGARYALCGGAEDGTRAAPLFGRYSCRSRAKRRGFPSSAAGSIDPAKGHTSVVVFRCQPSTSRAVAFSWMSRGAYNRESETRVLGRVEI